MDRSIGDCVDLSFAGEWGAEPNPSNAVVLRATDIDDAGNVTGAGAARSVPVSKLCAKQLQDGDILLEGSGGGPGKPVGRVALFEAKAHSDPAICSNFFRTLRPRRSAVNERFLWRKLGWFYTQPALLSLQQQTTGIINLKFAEYLDARIDLPAQLSEQAKIAEVLDTLDTTIRQTEAIIEKLKQVKHGLLHDLLTRGIDANGELRPPQSQAPHLYKDSSLGWIPCSWEPSDVAAEFEVTSGLTLGPHRRPRSNARKYLRVANVQRGRIDLADVAELGASDSEVASRALLPGDLLVVEGHASADEIGRCAMASETVRGFTFQNHLFRLRACRLDAAFGLCWMNSSGVRSYWRQEAATSSGLHTINRSKLNRVLVAVPELDEQHRIVSTVAAMDQRLLCERAQLSKLAVQKSGLMDDLLTGRVRVTPLLANAHPR